MHYDCVFSWTRTNTNCYPKFQSWTKLSTGDVTEEVAWPVGRDGHASCLLTGPPNPQVLISGGWDKDNKLINDAWILNINTRVWKEVCTSSNKD